MRRLAVLLAIIGISGCGEPAGGHRDLNAVPREQPAADANKDAGPVTKIPMH